MLIVCMRLLIHFCFLELFFKYDYNYFIIMEFTKLFLDEISQYETIICFVSGGYHSTTSALKLFDHSFKNVYLLHNKTFLEMKSSSNTMKKLQEVTQYPYIETTPNLKNETVWDIMKRSLQRIPEVMEDIKNKRYNRRKFECCDKLKKDSGDYYLKTFKTHKMQISDKHIYYDFVVIDSSCPYESSRRSYYARDIRNKKTYLRFLKKRLFWKAYPFRDCFSEKPFLPYLKSKGFTKIKHSGCIICPILICFKIYNKNYYNTLKAMARAGMPCFQKTIESFI